MPTDELPFVDAHEIDLPCTSTEAWQGLTKKIRSSGMLGVRGFPDREEVAPKRIRLAGKHVFSTYQLAFDLDERNGTTHVVATTHAKFRRGLGRVYRALVIGSGMHARVMKRFLRQLRKQFDTAA